MNCVVNLEVILYLYLETKFSFAVSPNSFGILVYKLRTSKLIKTVSSVTFRLHIFKKSVLSLMLLSTWLVKGLKKLLILLVWHFGPPSIGVSFKSLGSEMVISSLFCSLIALYKNFQFLCFKTVIKVTCFKIIMT